MLYYYLSVFLSTALFTFLAITYLPQPFYNLAAISVKQVDVIWNDSLSEKSKDGLLIANLTNLLKTLFLFVFLLVLISIVALIPFLIYSFFDAAITDVSSWKFYAAMLVGSMVIFVKKKPSSDYSYWSKLLHELVLDNYHIGLRLFGKSTDAMDNRTTVNEQFFVVTGLARSGTTAFLNLIYDERHFHSTRYSDMPFIVSPKIWRRVGFKRTNKLRERAHGDGILVNEDSVEALEEYFYKMILRDEYIKERHLVEHSIDLKTYKSVLRFQEMYRKGIPETKYLTKNNNHILRHAAFLELNGQFKVFLLLRHPLEHAQSLYEQHKRFIYRQSQDPFIRKYMNWLGHHEFGLDHKEFVFEQQENCHNFERSSVNYWLEVWIYYYNYALKFIDKEQMILIDQKDVLNYPDKIKSATYRECGIRYVKTPERKRYTSRKKRAMGFDDELSDMAVALYDELIKMKLKFEEE